MSLILLRSKYDAFYAPLTQKKQAVSVTAQQALFVAVDVYQNKQQVAIFEVETLPSTVSLLQKRQYTSIVLRETFTSSVSLTQKKQAIALFDVETFPSTVSLLQKKQSIAISSSETIASIATISQKKQRVAITESETLSATVALLQKKQASYIVSDEVFSSTVAITQKKQQIALFDVETFPSTVSLLQNKQSIAISSVERFVSTVSLLQKKQAIALFDVETFPVTFSLLQKKQATAIRLVETLSSTVAITQKKQQVAISEVETFKTTVILLQKKQSIAIAQSETIPLTVGIVQKKQKVAISEVETLTATVSVFQKKQTININADRNTYLSGKIFGTTGGYGFLTSLTPSIKTFNSWQARLVAKDNTISQKMNDNNIRNTGYASDVFVIRETLNQINDVSSFDLLDIMMVNVIFPPMQDVPLWRFYGGGLNQNMGLKDIQSNDSATDHKTKGFECYAEVKYKVDQGSIILRFFDNPQGTNPHLPTGTDPWVLPLQVKDVRGTFGGRSMVYQKIILGYLDGPLPVQLSSLINTMSTRRQLLAW